MKIFGVKQAGFVVINIATRFAEVSEEDVTILVKEGVPKKPRRRRRTRLKLLKVRKLLIGHNCFKLTI